MERSTFLWAPWKMLPLTWYPHYLSIGGAFQVDRISPQPAGRRQMAPSLPPVVWGSTLNFLPYADVRSSLGIGRVFRHNVADHVEVLNIFSPLEMDVPTGRRFSNVTEVNILCLCKPKRTLDDSIVVNSTGYVMMEVCSLTVSKIVPFLLCFPKLKYVQIGFIHPDRYFMFFAPRRCLSEETNSAAVISTNINTQLFRRMICSLCGAFESRALQPLRRLDVISRFENIHMCEARDASAPCALCKRVCSFFPFPDVFCGSSMPCLKVWERLDVIASRPSGSDYLRESDRLAPFIERTSIFASDEVNLRHYHDPLSFETREYCVHLDTGIREAISHYIERYECRPPTFECSWVLQIGYEETCLGITKSTLQFLQESHFNIDPVSFRFVLDDCFDTEKAGQIKALERWGSIDELGSLSLWPDITWRSF